MKHSEKPPLDRAAELHPEWSELYNRVLRTAGGDSQLNREFAPLQDKMDTYLDAYNGDKTELDFLVVTQNVEPILPSEQEIQEFGRVPSPKEPWELDGLGTE